jgi:hypothetical protein
MSSIPDPTHDQDRDISGAAEARFDYDLVAGAAPTVEKTNPRMRAGIGPASEERNDLVHEGRRRVVARSGNQHWNDDGDESEFDLAADGPAPSAAPAKVSIGPTLIVGALVGLGVWALFLRKR